MNKKKIIILGLAILFFGVNYISGYAQDVEEIIRKAYNVAYYQGDDGKSEVTMTITDSQGRTRNRVFTILRFDIEDGGKQKYYVYFREPADVRDMVYMVWKHPGKDDDRWLYLPALDLVRRIAASDKRSSFVGSDFLYEDISGRALSLDDHQLKSEDEKQYVIRNTPKDPNLVEFSYYDIYINKGNFVPTKAEYYDKEKELFRRIEVLKIKEIEGFTTIVKQKASNLASGSETIVEFEEVDYNLGLSEDIFSERYLRRPPRRWIR
ncbi:MAG: outer membrane lipoprotein-sorting protein [Candidatus Omnitrophica bacterium]|nr:outer membrane lipoprotein-sorting protein [Candidatus Omnitrophota bacterium]